MLPDICLFDEPLYVVVVHWVTSCFSIPIYSTAFLILIFKSPEKFNSYRNYLVAHIFSGFLLDYHTRIIWKLTVILPWAIMCSNGFAAQYAIRSFQFFCILLLVAGWTGVYLFIYRMKVATQHVEHLKFQKTVMYLYYLFFGFSGIFIVFLVLIYPELKDQNKHKAMLEQKLGPLPEFAWCENCFSIRFDTWKFLTFYSIAYFTLLLAFSCGFLAAFETYRCLNSKNLRLSARTAATQRNFMFSLIMMLTVHILFFFSPLALHFVAHFVVVSHSYLARFAIVALQDHGSIITLTMMLTNNLLRKTTKDLFLGVIVCKTDSDNSRTSPPNVLSLT